MVEAGMLKQPSHILCSLHFECTSSVGAHESAHSAHNQARLPQPLTLISWNFMALIPAVTEAGCVGTMYVGVLFLLDLIDGRHSTMEPLPACSHIGAEGE